VALKAAFDEISALNWPVYAAMTLAVIVAIFAVLQRWLAILVLLGTEVADGANWLINAIVHRPRPSGFGVFVDRQITGYFSFPSGHIEHAVAILGLVVFLTFQVRRPAPWLNAVLWVVRLVLLADIVLMVPARLLEGEHWPSDTLAAMLFGGFWLLLGIQVYRGAARRWPRLLGVGERETAVAAA
jgi:membrane-associated phospholipid phosphatase